MKQTLLAAFLILLINLSVFGQWKTIYEAGYGTSIPLNDDCIPIFRFYSSADQTTISFNSTDDQNRLRMHALLSPFDNDSELSAGFLKFLPEMSQYASLRVYLDMNLPDSVGTIHYAKMTDTLLNDPVTGSIRWNDFDTGQLSQWLYLSNLEGDNTFYIYTTCKISPAVIRYDYLRIEADTTAMLNLISASLDSDEIHVFSSGNFIQIIPTDITTEYDLKVFDLSGNCVYHEVHSDQQQIPMNLEQGIYFVSVEQGHWSKQLKIYLE